MLPVIRSSLHWSDLADNPSLLIPAGIYIIMSLVGFALMGSDKRRAIRRQWRIPETRCLASLF